ncbi:MAG: aspartate aminotransferase family protein, partial [Rhizobiaceae bacterium]|nr:aspartate aminotransferase family protein [Rhizobiaceae bacterium]
ASYLPLAAEGERDPSHYVPELSRRARGFPTWAMIKHLGRQGIQELVDGACDAAASIASPLAIEPGIAVINDVVLNQVIVRFGSDLEAKQSDMLTQQVIGTLQRDGTIFVGGATWRGRQVKRVSVCNYQIDGFQASIISDVILRLYRDERAKVSWF